MEDDIYSLFDEAPPVNYKIINDSNIINNNNNNNCIKPSSFSNNINIQNQSKCQSFQHCFNIINESNKNCNLLNINLSPEKLKELSKDYLTDLILLIKGFYEIFIEGEYIILKQDIFKIIKDLRNINRYLKIAHKYDNKDILNLKKENIKNKKENNINNINISKNEIIEKKLINENKEEVKKENNINSGNNINFLD